MIRNLDGAYMGFSRIRGTTWGYPERELQMHHKVNYMFIFSLITDRRRLEWGNYG